MALSCQPGLSHDTTLRHLYRVPGRAGEVVDVVEYIVAVVPLKKSRKERRMRRKYSGWNIVTEEL